MAKIKRKNEEDVGRKICDADLKKLEKKISASYNAAAKEMKADLSDFLEKYKARDEEKRAQLAAGKITEKQYTDWKERQIWRSNAMQAKIDDLTQTAVNADKVAMQMVNKELPNIYTTSYNFAGFRGEEYAAAAGLSYKDFTIINADAVRNLATDPDLLPWYPKPDLKKDELWNKKHIQTAVQQGIIKGDSMDKIADRLQAVVDMDEHAAIRTARTAVTSAENKGRFDATQRVKEAGVPMTNHWICTHDSKTRDTHLLLDETTPNEDGYFGEGILDPFHLMQYPADPNGEPQEVYNCRCALVARLDEIDHSHDMELYDKFMHDNYYNDWLDYKEKHEQKMGAYEKKKEGAAWRVAAAKERKAAKAGAAAKKEIIPDNLPASTIQVIGEKGEAIAPETLIKTVNPNYPEAGYTMNCQRCVVGYELGRRGYDVEAMAFDGSYLTTSSVFDIQPQLRHGALKDTYITGKDSTLPHFAQDKYPFNRSPKTTANSVVRAMTDWGDGARATLEVSWRTGGYHVVNVENIGGKVKIIDSQNGMIFDDIEKYLSRTKCAETELRRTDVLFIRDNIPQEQLLRIVKKRG